MLSLRTKIVLKVGALALIVMTIGTIVLYVALTGAPTVQEPTPPSSTGTPVALPGSGAFEPGVVNPETPTSGLPISDIADGGKVLTVQLTSSSITSPSLVNGGQIAYYDKRDGKFYTIDKGGNVISLSDATFPQAQTVVFSDAADKAAIEFPDGSNIIFDFKTGKQTTLPNHWEDFAFSSDGSQVASKSIGIEANNRALVITSADGSNTKAIAGLGNNADSVTVAFSPTNNIVAFSETGSAQSVFGREEIYMIDNSGEAAGSIIVDGANFGGLWSPDSTHLLYSVADISHELPSLWYTVGYGTDIGSSRKQLALATWVEKCTFKDATFVLCAVPRSIPDGGGFDHRLVTSSDDLYQVNVTTGRTSLLGSPATDLQMFNLNISDDGSLIYFTDSLGRLNSMRLR